jgi:hypothetical protein
MTNGFMRFLRRNTIALLALFIALGGTTYAATALPANSVGPKQLKKNAVTNPKIKNGAVTGAKVADNSIKGADVLESSLGKVPSATSADNATHATSADNATHATSADSATTAGSAAPSGAAGGSLAGTYPSPTIAANTVGSSQITNGSLTGADVGIAAGTSTLDFPSIAAGTCTYILVNPGVGDISNDPVLVSNSNLVPEELVATGWHSNLTDFFRLRLCNVSAGALDAPSTDYYWVVFNNS